LERLMDELEVKQDARPDGGSMRTLVCDEQRMARSLHGRWPYRRSHCRHDLHWLVQVQAGRCWGSSGRMHAITGLRPYTRRPSP
jgi:hypothetical protein